MKVIKNFGGDAPWGVIPYIQKTLDTLSDDNSENAFFNGVEFIDNKNLRDEYKDYKRRVLFAHWSPCEFLVRHNYFYFDSFEFFTEVYCVCPYTCKFMNEYFGHEKFKYIPYPYSNYTVKSFGEYNSLCCWFGSIHGQDHIDAIETIGKYDYKFITSQQNTWMHHPYEYNKCTHINITTEDKLIEVSKTKSCLTFNKLYMNGSSQNNSTHGNIFNKAFNNWDKKIMPQFKVRTHEIATCKSLILCYKDEWNLIEDFYEPGKDFIYFSDFKQLDELLIDVNNNFDKYKPIIENAYNKVQNYSVEKIFEYIKTGDESLVTWDKRKAK
jgi:hypothetical protein